MTLNCHLATQNIKYLAVIIAKCVNYVSRLEQMMFGFGYPVTYGEKKETKIPRLRFCTIEWQLAFQESPLLINHGCH